MTELERIDRLRRRFHLPARGLVLGIGDDCAIFRPTGSPDDLVFTTDQVVEGVHFPSGATARRIGEKALARALSDIAAMAADPRFCLISLAIPAHFNLDGFYKGIATIADRYQVAVAGGDLAKSKTITADITVCGSVPRNAALRRDTAKPGDAIYVSGPLGRAASRHYRDTPEPRIAFARRHLRHRATACMDLSDGLSLDLHRLCLASGTSAALTEIPVANGATLHQALHGGEDYELLYTGHDLPGIRIGTMLPGDPAGAITLDNIDLPREGWDHFA